MIARTRAPCVGRVDMEGGMLSAGLTKKTSTANVLVEFALVTVMLIV